MAGVSPTQNTLKRLRAAGWTCQVVEQPYNQYTKCRKDLYGFIDIMGIRGPVHGRSIDGFTTETTVIGVQCTSRSNTSSRFKKILSCDSAVVWLEAGNAIEVHGWKKIKGRWECKVIEITLDDFDGDVE